MLNSRDEIARLLQDADVSESRIEELVITPVNDAVERRLTGPLSMQTYVRLIQAGVPMDTRNEVMGLVNEYVSKNRKTLEKLLSDHDLLSPDITETLDRVDRYWAEGRLD